LADRGRGTFLYCLDDQHWYHHHAGRWQPNLGRAQIMQAAEASAEMIPDRAQRQRAGMRPRLEAAVGLAACEPGLAVRTSEFDRNKTLFNLQNGTVNLSMGQLRPHAPEDRITHLAPVSFDTNARCSGWLAFVDWLTCRDQTLARYLQCLAGYCCSGLTHEKKIWLFFGPRGNNGKTVFMTVLCRLLGSYATTTPARTILTDGTGDHPTALADLAGKRLVWVLEVGEGQQLNESLIKGMTGSDPIKARRMLENFWQYEPQFKLLLPCNHLLEVRGTDSAIWGRLSVVPFNAHVADEEIDPNLADTLLAEGPGIVNWLVDGFQEWAKNGLPACAAVAAASAEYRTDMDELRDFFAARTVEAKDDYCEFGPLYRAYLGWAGTAGVDRPKSKRALGLDLKARGFRRQESNGFTKWWGLRLRDNVPLDGSDNHDERHTSPVALNGSTQHTPDRDRSSTDDPVKSSRLVLDL
jgi:putative DNA primase/helicase